MNGPKIESNDRLGLCGITYAVPKEMARPESAVKADVDESRHFTIQQQWSYWLSRQERYKKNRKGQDAAADAKDEIV